MGDLLHDRFWLAGCSTTAGPLAAHDLESQCRLPNKVGEVVFQGPKSATTSSARGLQLEGHADIRKGLPSDAAFSQCMSGIEGKVEFGWKVRGARKMQAGTVIAQIADDTIDRRAAGQNEPGALKYFRPRNAPTLNHGQTSYI
jgi:hypothetical protein